MPRVVHVHFKAVDGAHAAHSRLAAEADERQHGEAAVLDLGAGGEGDQIGVARARAARATFACTRRVHVRHPQLSCAIAEQMTRTTNPGKARLCPHLLDLLLLAELAHGVKGRDAHGAALGVV